MTYKTYMEKLLNSVKGRKRRNKWEYARFMDGKSQKLL